MIHSGQITELFSGRKDLSKKTRISGRMILFGFTALFLFCLVGAGGIGAPLIFAMNQYDWNKAGAILLGLILLVWGVDILSSRR